LYELVDQGGEKGDDNLWGRHWEAYKRTREYFQWKSRQDE